MHVCMIHVYRFVEARVRPQVVRMGLVGARSRAGVRAQVMCKPGTVKPHKLFEAEIYALNKEEGGRHKPFFSNYKPQFYFRTADITGARRSASAGCSRGSAALVGHPQVVLRRQAYYKTHVWMEAEAGLCLFCGQANCRRLTGDSRGRGAGGMCGIGALGHGLVMSGDVR
jgi:hypothetical protein